VDAGLGRAFVGLDENGEKFRLSTAFLQLFLIDVLRVDLQGDLALTVMRSIRRSCLYGRR
jgi:hypothetical protein